MWLWFLRLDRLVQTPLRLATSLVTSEDAMRGLLAGIGLSRGIMGKLDLRLGFAVRVL